MTTGSGSATTFRDMVEAAHAGSEPALWELVERVTPHVVRVVRHRLAPGLRRRFDSGDFVQMTLASFLLHEKPLTEFRDEKHLLGYVAGIAANKVRMLTRDHLDRECRDPRREVGLEAQGTEKVALAAPTPSEVAEFRETWNQYVVSSPPVEREIIERRLAGQTFKQIGEALNMAPSNVRRRLNLLCDQEVT